LIKFLKLASSVILSLLIGGVSGIATSGEINGWYQNLNKPSFNPPNWVFGPVWTLLYLLMGVSLYLIWILPASKEKNKAIVVFFVQMTLNFFWSFLFFKFKLMGWAFVEIVILWVLIIWTISLFYKLKKSAGLINIPYLLWVTFASFLNLAYFLLN
jgi:benzodiazapine receptor